MQKQNSSFESKRKFNKSATSGRKSDKPRTSQKPLWDNDDKPRSANANQDDRPKRRFDNRDEKKPFDRDRKPRFDNDNNRDERPKRRFDNRDEKKPFDRDRKPRFDNDNNRDERPKRRFDNRDEKKPFDRDRKPRFDNDNNHDERPKRRFDNRDEKKPFDRDRKPRFDNDNNRDERPKRRFDNRDEKKPFDRDRKPRFDNDNNRDERPKRRFDNRDEKKPFDRDRKPRFDNDNNRDERPSFEGRESRYNNNDRPSYKKKEYVYKERPNYSENAPKAAKKLRKRKGPLDVMRLNRFIANSGVCSRREADTYITTGLISVNGQIVTELGTKVSPNDEVRFNGEILRGEKKVYVLLNKPKGYVTTVEDPHADRTVMELVHDACPERIYPVGRLDTNTMGVLLFTNDGDLTKQLTHPSYNKKKVYHVFLDKNVSTTDLEKLVAGVELEDGMAYADAAEYADPADKTQVGLEIHSGRNRIVRRMFEHLGYKVVKLDRVYFAGLTKQRLRRGEYRLLTRAEIERLQMGAYD